MERIAKFNAAKQVFVGIVTQYGPALGINNGQQWVNQQFQHIVADLGTLDGIDKMFVAVDHQNTNNRTQQVLQHMVDILNQYTAPNTQLRQHVQQEVQNLSNYINAVKAHRPANVAPNQNRNAGIEKYITACKVLKTALDAVTKDCDAWIVKTRNQVAGYRGQLTVAQQLHTNFTTNLRASVARGLAAAQKMKANPNEATYDHEMDKGARDLQAVLVLARQNNNWQAWNVANPTNHLQALLPFAGGAMRTIPAHTPEATIRQQISQFNTLVKNIKQAYNV
jgi:hypothetical protein